MRCVEWGGGSDRRFVSARSASNWVRESDEERSDSRGGMASRDLFPSTSSGFEWMRNLASECARERYASLILSVVSDRRDLLKCNDLKRRGMTPCWRRVPRDCLLRASEWTRSDKRGSEFTDSLM